MNKVYQRTYWENKPSEKTPINEANLNKMDYALDEIDNRVVKFARQKDAMETATQNANTAATNANTATANATKATESANKATQSATTAANNANEAAQSIIDEKYILTARTEFTKSTSVSPTAMGNAILEKLRGDSWQRKLTGKNFYDEKTLTVASTQNGITTKRNNNGFINFAGTATANVNIVQRPFTLQPGTYTYSFVREGINTNGVIVCLYNRTDFAFISPGVNNTTFTIDKETELDIRLQAQSGATVNVDICIQIEKGTEATPIEEFCGNTPSPNPSFEQKIRSVGDIGWFDGELKQGGYHAATGEYTNSNQYVCGVNTIPCKEGDEIRVSYDCDAEYSTVYWYADGVYLTRVSGNNCIAPSGATEFRFHLYNYNGITVTEVGHVCVTINGKYALIVDEVGKNIWNEEWEVGALNSTNGNDYDMIGRIRSVGYTAIEPNTVYSSSIIACALYYYREDKTWIGNTHIQGNTFTTPAAARYMRIEFSGSYGDTYKNDLCISKGTDASYKPHESTRHYIPLDEPLRGIGDVKDEVLPQEGLYGQYRQYIKWVVDGSQEIVSNRVLTNTAVWSIIDDSILYAEGWCDRLIYEADWSLDKEHFYHNGNQIFIFTPIECGTTVSEIKAYFAENPYTFILPLKEPTFTPFADQSTFYDLMAYDEVTHVFIAGCHEELNPSAVIRFPRNEDGALVTTNWCDNKKNEIAMNELKVALMELGRL